MHCLRIYNQCTEQSKIGQKLVFSTWSFVQNSLNILIYFFELSNDLQYFIIVLNRGVEVGSSAPNK